MIDSGTITIASCRPFLPHRREQIISILCPTEQEFVLGSFLKGQTMSSPLQMAREQCANMQRNSCLGIPVRCLQSTEPLVAAPLDRCKLADSKGTCAYFEKVVLPLVQYFPRYARAVELYRKRLPKAAATPAAVIGMWECDCGNPMPKGRRMCDQCATKNRRKTWRHAQIRKRELAVNS